MTPSRGSLALRQHAWPAVAVLVGLTAIAACAGTAGGDAGDVAGAASASRVALAPHGSLARLLPEPNDWTRGDVASAEVDLPAPASHAAASYTRGDARIDVEITDTGGDAEYLEATQQIAGTNFDRVSDNGYIRGARVRGSPAVESWNHVDRLAEITVLVDQRFVVHASASGLDGIEALRSFVEAISLAEISALRPR
jgi:hypothetical protein